MKLYQAQQHIENSTDQATNKKIIETMKLAD
jgi:hypothetical protein